MNNRIVHRWFARLSWGAIPLSFLFLLVEFFDELHYTINGAALPAMRAELGLSYAQVGLLFGAADIIGTLIEPVIMLLGDTRLRKRLIIGGGLALALGLVLVGSALSFPVLMLAFLINFPASGAFVTLGQATLMDQNPGREAQMMARWSFAGSAGNLVGPLLLSAGFSLGLGWRWAFFGLAGLAVSLVLVIFSRPFPANPQPAPTEQDEAPESAPSILRALWAALRNPLLLRWFLLMEVADLLLDGFAEYLPLYFTDVSGLTNAQASLAFSVLLVAGLAADAVLIPLLEKVPGRRVVLVSAAGALVVYTAWLLAPWMWAKIALLLAIRFCTIGWYPVLQGEAFAALPGRSGTVMAINSLAGIVGGGIAILLGMVADRFGLPAAMWLMLLAPVSLLLGMPRQGNEA